MRLLPWFLSQVIYHRHIATVLIFVNISCWHIKINISMCWFLYPEIVLNLLVLCSLGGIFRGFSLVNLETVTVLLLYQSGYISLYLSLAYLLCLGLLALCWIKLVRVGILTLFQTLECFQLSLTPYNLSYWLTIRSLFWKVIELWE